MPAGPTLPDGQENQSAVNMAFVHQAAPDIQHKFQRLEGFVGKQLTKLVVKAEKIYNNRELQRTDETRGWRRSCCGPDMTCDRPDMKDIRNLAYQREGVSGLLPGQVS